jgi:hypothetical protein
LKTCPDCLSGIAAAATFCNHCGERVEGKPCGGCGARNWEQARVCRWCRTAFEEAGTQIEFAPFTVSARPLPTLLQRGRLLAQTIELGRDKIVIRTPGVFNLSRREEEIPWRKVAGFDYHSGIIWDRVRIETRGQSSSTIACLAKRDGRRIREVLQALES